MKVYNKDCPQCPYQGRDDLCPCTVVEIIEISDVEVELIRASLKPKGELQ